MSSKFNKENNSDRIQFGATYSEVAVYFFRLGLLGFGGPMALASYMRKDLSVDRKWMPVAEFDQVFAMIKMMPGPIAFMTAVFFGQHRKGFWGATLAGLGIVLPALFMVIAIASYETMLMQNQFFQHWFRGLQLAAIGIIYASIFSLASAHLKKLLYWILVFVAGILFWENTLPEPGIILLLGLFWVIAQKMKRSSSNQISNFGLLAMGKVPMVQLTLACLKAGAFVFGSGLAIVPMLETDFVQRLGWMNHVDFMNALSVGQLTPGPVVITVGYIGFKKLGMIGAFAACFAIFLPSFFHMVTWFPRLLPKLLKTEWIKDFSFAAIAAVVGCLIVSTTMIVKSVQVSPIEVILIGLACLLSARMKINAVFVVMGCGFVEALVAYL